MPGVQRLLGIRLGRLLLCTASKGVVGRWNDFRLTNQIVIPPQLPIALVGYSVGVRTFGKVLRIVEPYALAFLALVLRGFQGMSSSSKKPPQIKLCRRLYIFLVSHMAPYF
jgi:hypothetical protein